MEKSKKEKILEVLVIVFGLIIVFGTAYFASELKNCESCDKKLDLSLISDADTKNLKDSKTVKFGDVIESNGYQVVYLARPTCSHCLNQTPIMESIATNKKVDIYYLNIDTINEQQFYQLVSIDTDLFGAKGSKFGTPTIIILKDKKIIDSIIGEASEDNVIDLLKTYDLV